MPAYTPAEIHALFQRAFNQGDVEALVALYEPDAVLMIGGKEMKGRESIRKALDDRLKARGRMTLETRGVIESHGLAVLHGAWAIEGGTQGLSTEVVRKQPDGTWLFLIDNPHTPIP